MTKELSVGKALEKLRGSDEPKSRMTRLEEKNKALDEELRRLRAMTGRLERDNPGTKRERKVRLDALGFEWSGKKPR